MAFFSQKEHKSKRSHSTDRKKPHSTASITTIPSLPALTRSSSRPKTAQDPNSTDVHVLGLDHRSSAPKLITTPSKHSLRRVPVPSLSIQDSEILPYGRLRASPIVPSSSSTSTSGKSSIADISGACNALSARKKVDHIRSADRTGTSTPPRSSPHEWDSSSAGSRNPGGAYDPEKTISPISDLANLIFSTKPILTSLSSPKSGSQKPQRAVLRRKSNAKHPKSQPSNQSSPHHKSKQDSVTATPQRALASADRFPYSISTPLSLDAARGSRRSTTDERKPSSPGNISPSQSPQVLTPAGAVAAAYREQEKRKKDLKDFIRANPDDPSQRDSSDDNGRVYYTVFGSSSKIAAAGRLENSLPNDPSNITSARPRVLSRKPSISALGKLSKKPSTKAKKDSSCGFMSESECGHDRDEVRRASYQGRRSTSVPGKHRSKKSLGIAIEASEFGLIWDSPQSATTPSKSADWSVDDPSPSAGGKIWKLMKRLSTGGLRDKYQAQNAAPPVPALPEGLLSTPPPQSNASSPQNTPEDSKPPQSRYVRGRSSFGDAPFTNRHRSIQGFSSLVSSPRTPVSSGGKYRSHRRQSTNTRPPSPVASDIALWKYRRKSRSSSASTSEEVPPLPGRDTPSRHILSPLELNKLEKEQATTELVSPHSTVDSHSPTTSAQNYQGTVMITPRRPSMSQGLHFQASGDDSETDGMSTSEFAALPTPPRHHYKSNSHVYHQSNGSGQNLGSTSTSPTIPMFSTLDVVNQFQSERGNGAGMSRSLNSSSTSQSPVMSSDEFCVANLAQPPPRPRRSDKRRPLAIDEHIAMRASSDREGDRQNGRHNRGVQLPTLAPLSRGEANGL